MVRFKAAPDDIPVPAQQISIPLWCDLKLAGPDLPVKRHPDFHPTMVRFKGMAGGLDK